MSAQYHKRPLMLKHISHRKGNEILPNLDNNNSNNYNNNNNNDNDNNMYMQGRRRFSKYGTAMKC